MLLDGHMSSSRRNEKHLKVTFVTAAAAAAAAEEEEQEAETGGGEELGEIRQTESSQSRQRPTFFGLQRWASPAPLKSVSECCFALRGRLAGSLTSRLLLLCAGGRRPIKNMAVHSHPGPKVGAETLSTFWCCFHLRGMQMRSHFYFLMVLSISKQQQSLLQWPAPTAGKPHPTLTQHISTLLRLVQEHVSSSFGQGEGSPGLPFFLEKKTVS